jgi:simple sugar transport system permease protein
MTDESGPAPVAPSPGDPAGKAVPSVAERLALLHRAGGIVTPVITAVLAFVIGGFVVLASGSNPLETYWDILKGTGLGWFIPGLGDRADAANDLQQTLILTTTLILVGLAVAFAFRCGLFNIGGQGQYLVGSIFAVWVGTSLGGTPGWLHVLLAVVIAAAAGAVWAGIAGFLKATVGAHEVISTIMLNWIAVWGGSYLVGLNGPLQDPEQEFNPISADVHEGAQLPTLWGEEGLQPLHWGLFIALGALVAYWITLNRTTLGYEVRAVGYNPEAARYGGISVRRNYFLAMAISGAFAGLAGAVDVLGVYHHISEIDIRTSQIGFVGIAVALLGRNTAVGTLFAALLFGALIVGTSTRNLTGGFDPQLAGNLTLIIQGLVVLFVGADLLVLYVWQARRRLAFWRSGG